MIAVIVLLAVIAVALVALAWFAFLAPAPSTNITPIYTPAATGIVYPFLPTVNQ